MNRMMNNPLMILLNNARNGGNPAQLMMQMAQTDPRMAQAVGMMKGKSPAELRKMAENMCRERGTPPQQILQSLGLR